jgi:hypothetical protein
VRGGFLMKKGIPIVVPTIQVLFVLLFLFSDLVTGNPRPPKRKKIKKAILFSPILLIALFLILGWISVLNVFYFATILIGGFIIRCIKPAIKETKEVAL